MGALLVFFAAAARARAADGVAAAGRRARLEVRLRLRFLEKVPRLGDRYFHSRPTSDMAERSHSLHGSAQLPALAGRFVRVVCRAAGHDGGHRAGSIRRARRWRSLLAVVSAGLPLAAQPVLAERDLRVRSHAGALSRFYLDALLGLVADPRPRRRARRCGASTRAAASSGLRGGAQLAARARSRSRRSRRSLRLRLAAWLLLSHLVARRRRERAPAALLGAAAAGARRGARARSCASIPAHAQRRRCACSSRSARRTAARAGGRRRHRAASAGGWRDRRLRAASTVRRRRAHDPRRASISRSQPARTSPSSARPARASRPWSACCSAGTGRRPAGCSSTAQPLDGARLARLRRRDGVGRSGGAALEPLAARQPAATATRRRAHAAGFAVRRARTCSERAREAARRPADAARRGRRAGLGRRGPARAARAARCCGRRRASSILDEPFRGLDRERAPRAAGLRPRALAATRRCSASPTTSARRSASTACWSSRAAAIVEDGAPAELAARAGLALPQLLEAEERRARAALVERRRGGGCGSTAGVCRDAARGGAA